MKTTLTIAESKRLIELGIDPSKASGESLVGGALFTLSDILSILPTTLIHPTIFDDEDVCPLEMRWDMHELKWITYYDNVGLPVNPERPQDRFTAAPELIDSLYTLLIWTIEHHHINPEKK